MTDRTPALATARRLAAPVLLGVSFLALAPAPSARAQVAFVPTIGQFPSGVTLPVTPVVSADRRYVRLTLTPQFNALEAINNISVPAAVSSGPGGPGALGGLGGLGGIGGGGGGGAGGGAGLHFFAGMDGVSAPVSGNVDPSLMGFAGMSSGYGSRPMMSPYASADASAVLSGMAVPAARPSLSAGMVEEYAPTPRVKPRPKRTVKAKRR
jgi:hypothetical protein